MTTIHFPSFEKFCEYAGDRDNLDPWSTYRQGWLDAIALIEVAQQSVQRTADDATFEKIVQPDCDMPGDGYP